MQQLKRIPHPSGTQIQFDAKWHQYKINGTALRSVSKLLDRYFPFDEKRVLQLVSKKTGQPVDEVKRSWSRQALLGKNVHEYIECRLLQKPPPTFLLLLQRRQAREAARPADATGPASITSTALEDEVLHGEEASYIAVADAAVDRVLAQYDCISSEQVIAAPAWGLAGTVDFIGRNKRNNKILIGDWKTSGSVTSNFRFGSFETPCPGCLRHLPNSKFYRYAMQVIVYSRILAREQYFQQKFFDAPLRASLSAVNATASSPSSSSSSAGGSQEDEQQQPSQENSATAAKKSKSAKQKKKGGRKGKSDAAESADDGVATTTAAAAGGASSSSSLLLSPAEVEGLLDAYYHDGRMEEKFEYGIVQLLKNEEGEVVAEFKEVTPATVLPVDVPEMSFDELLQRVMVGEGV